MKWLNGERRVQEILKDQFDGRVITEQNISDWKQTGHPDWVRREEARLLAQRLTEQSDDLDATTNGHPISDRFASVLAAELARLAMTLLEKETDPEKSWHRLCSVHRELSQLRRDDHRAVRTKIERDRRDQEVETEAQKEHIRAIQADKSRMIGMCFAPMHNRTMAEAFGGGEYGEKMAEMLHRIKFDLPLDDMLRETASKKAGPASAQENPGESSLIQPNPANFSNGHSPVTTDSESG